MINSLLEHYDFVSKNRNSNSQKNLNKYCPNLGWVRPVAAARRTSTPASGRPSRRPSFSKASRRPRSVYQHDLIPQQPSPSYPFVLLVPPLTSSSSSSLPSSILLTQATKVRFLAQVVAPGVPPLIPPPGRPSSSPEQLPRRHRITHK